MTEPEPEPMDDDPWTPEEEEFVREALTITVLPRREDQDS